MSRVSVVNPGNSINDQAPSAPRKRSKFSLPFIQYGTSRFGEVGVCYVNDTVPGDHFQNINRSKVDTMSLKAPMDDSLRHRRDFFFVPYSAILPRNWELFITQPNRGDDIPVTAGSGTQFNYPTEILKSMFTIIQSKYFTDNGAGFQTRAASQALLYFVFFAESLYSDGCLANYLGANFGAGFTQSLFTLTTDNNFDKLFDDTMNVLTQQVKSIVMADSVSGTKRYFFDPPYTSKEDWNNIRDFIDDFRQGHLSFGNMPPEYQTGCTAATLANALGKIWIEEIDGYVKNDGSNDPFSYSFGSPRGKFNLARFYAYQLSVAHFYSNDAIDNVFTAELYRQNFRAANQAMISSLGISSYDTFTWNGISLPFDDLASKWIDNVYTDRSTAFGSSIDPGKLYKLWCVWSMVFSFRKSLKYVDYFTGLRTSPMAVGQTSINVQSGSPNYVNVVDVTRAILMQRFLNAVNRSGRKIANYIQEMFGVTPKKDICDPLFLVHYDDSIGAVTIENTGYDQLTSANSQTSRLLGSARFEVSFDADAYGVLIGLDYYDYVRKYPFSTSPLIMQNDRFDLFNPFLENAGDQACNASLYNPLVTSTLGYQQRYMEYKQTFARAVGGFIRNLPGYAFVASQPIVTALNSDFIRSYNRELDDYYVSLTGYSLGTYFHFIVKNETDSVVDRNMSSNAQIL